MAVGHWHKGPEEEGNLGDKDLRSDLEEEDSPPWGGVAAIDSELGHRNIPFADFGLGTRIHRGEDYSREGDLDVRNRRREGDMRDGLESENAPVPEREHQVESIECQNQT